MSFWPNKSIASLGTVITGSTPKTSEERFYGGDIPFVTPSELDQIDPIVNAARTLSESGSRESRLLPEGTVMVCCIGSLGKVGIAGRTVASNQQINSIIFDPNLVLPRFGLYACRLLKPKLETLAPATTVPIVSKSKFEQLEISVPPLSEQKRIADTLDRAEALRAKRRTALVQLDELVKSIFFEMFGDPVKNPKNWKKKELKEFGEIITGNTPSRKKPEYYGDFIEWIKSDNINTPHTYLTKSEEMLSESGVKVGRTVPANSVLVTCIAGSLSCIGNVAVADRNVAFNQQINAIIPNQNTNTLFLYHLILNTKEYIQNHSTQSMKGMISKGEFGTISFILPPMEAQTKFAELAKRIEKMRTSQNQSLLEIDDLFDSLMNEAFNGKLFSHKSSSDK